jgi:hypothetical protein
MYPIHFTSRARLLAFALMATHLLHATELRARSIESLSLNFERVAFDYVPMSDAALPFGLEITIHGDDRVELRLPGVAGASDVTLKRGIVGAASADDHLEFSYRSRPLQSPEIGRLGMHVIDAGRIDVEVLDAVASGAPVGSDTLRFQLQRRDLGDRIELTFVGREGQILTGSPAAVFGPRGTGKTIAAVLLAPPAGSEIELMLRVTDQHGGGTLIPIKIKHNV